MPESDNSLDTLIPEFIEESLEHLQAVDDNLMAMEKNPGDIECVQKVFRSVHSIKGCAAFFGLDDIRSLSHSAETLLDRVRTGNKRITPRIVQRLFASFDLLKSLVAELVKAHDEGVSPKTGGDERVEEELAELANTLNEPDEEQEEKKNAEEKACVAAAPWGELSENLLKDFRIEALENIDLCEKALVNLDKNRGEIECIKDLFRGIHSVKGTSSYLGLEAISSLAHELESLLEIVRRQSSPRMDDILLDVCFEAVDHLKGMVGSPLDQSFMEKASKLRESIADEAVRYGGADAERVRDTVTKTNPVDIFLNAASQHVEALSLFLAEATVGTMPDAGRMDASFRAAHSLKGGARYMGLEVVERHAISIEEALQILKGGDLVVALPGIKDMIAESLAEVERTLNEMSLSKNGSLPPSEALPTCDGSAIAPKVIASPATPRKPTAEIAVSAKTMRVDQSLLDTFMNLVGELIVAKNALRHTQRHIELGDGDARGALKELKTTFFSIERVSDEMRRSVMRMRMVPVRKVFEKFPRMARDITRKNGKKVDLVFQGEDTEIDKGVVEELGDPLVHIIRNSLDHGIERPEIRLQAGKSETGTILLKAAHEGNSIIIEAIDDGKGIDPDVILRKARERHLVSEDDAAGLSKEEIYNFIFMPGFSTAEQVTDISGRGVGMDVVLTNLRKLKGSVRVSSEPGQGTRVRLEVPLTLAMVEAMLVKSGGNAYAIPMDAVKETVKVPVGEVKSLMSKKVVCLRGEMVGTMPLAELLGGKELTRMSESSDNSAISDDLRILAIEAGNGRVGVVVDAILSHEEIVVKPLAECLAGLPGLAGASVMGDGRAILILDPAQLVAMAAGRQK